MADFDKIKINGVPYNVKDTATAQAVAQVANDLAETNSTVQQQGQQISQQGQQISQQGEQIEQLQQAIAEGAQNGWNNSNTAINAVVAGMPDSGDVSSFLNTLQSSNPGKAIVVPYGDYDASGTINITAPQFFFYGNLTSTADIAFQTTGSNQRIYIRQINGQSTSAGVGLKVSGKQNGTGRNVVCVDYISNFNIALMLEDTVISGGGVLRNQFMFNYFDYVAYGIVLSATQAGSFVNQNYFLGGGIEASACAIETRGDQTDPFNGNIFVNVSFEESQKAVHLHNACRNVFRDFRFYENTQQASFQMDSNAYDNYFYGGSAEVFNENEISDMGTNYYYNMLLHGTDNVAYSSSFRSGGETIFTTLDQYRQNTSLGAVNPPTKSQFHSIIMDNNSIVIPAWFSADGAQHPFVLNVRAATNNTLMLFNGTVIASSNDTSGTSGMKLTPGHNYLVVSPTWIVGLD